MHFRKITWAAVWIIDWNRAREQRDRMVKGCRAAGVARRERSQEIFMTEKQQDLMPLVDGTGAGGRVKDASQFPPTELAETGVCLGGRKGRSHFEAGCT